MSRGISRCPRWPLAVAAVLCLAALTVPCSAKAGSRSSKSRYSFGSSYAAPKAPRVRKSSPPKPSSFGRDLSKSKRWDSPTPTALYPSHRKSSASAFRVTTPRRTSQRPARIAPLSLSPSIRYRKPTAAYRIPRSTSSQPDYYTSGLPKHRSEAAKQRFLRQRGLKHVPRGYEVDHIVPLSEGGSDTPANMEFLTKSAHHRKTAAEAKRYGWDKRR